MATNLYALSFKIQTRLTGRNVSTPDSLADQNTSVVSNTALSAHTKSSLPPFNHILGFGRSVFDWLLERQQNPRIGERRKLDYVAAMAHSPLHRGVGQRTPAWIITHLGVRGEGQASEWAKLRPGMAVRLFDEELSERNYGFENVWIFGVIGRAYGREPGYHIYWLETHLLTITRDPIPVCISAALIAIPNHLLPEKHHLNRLHECTLGQRLVPGLPHLQPPLRPWENDWAWKHPEMTKIDQWRRGVKTTLEGDWSRHHNRD